MSEPRKDVLQPVDDEARRLADTLLRGSGHAALASLRAGDGWPLASRVSMTTDHRGCPVLLLSNLSAHSAALRAEPRCSLLLGEAGKGDPLAHPRMTLFCTASELERDAAETETVRRRFLNRHPKAKLYVDFRDFSFFRLDPSEASLNGGFARAYALTPDDLLCDAHICTELAASDQRAIDHMNEDHLDAIDLYARHYGRRAAGDWRIVAVDPHGLDIRHGEEMARIRFPRPLERAGDLRMILVDMAREARAAVA